MKMEKACNLDVPAGATPMTIADAILRELDSETLKDVLYYIDCFWKKYREEVTSNEPEGRNVEV